MHAGCIRLEGRTHVHMGGPPPRALWTASVPVNKRTSVPVNKRTSVPVNKRTVEVTCGMTHAGDILEGRVVVCWKDRVVVTCMCQFMPETSWRAMHAGCTWRAERMSRATNFNEAHSFLKVGEVESQICQILEDEECLRPPLVSKCSKMAGRLPQI